VRHLNATDSPRLISSILGVATELATGVIPFSLVVHYSVSAEAIVVYGFPLLIIQFPSWILMAAFGDSDHASWVGDLVLCCAFLLQAALFGYAWFRFFTRPKRETESVAQTLLL